MTALELIANLREKGIRISAVEGELELDAPAGALTDELRAELIAKKPELLRLLSWSRRSGRSVAKPLERVSRSDRLPLSWAQQRLWFLDQLEPGSSAYNISWTVRMRGELVTESMQAALDELVLRHESLRTRFPVVEGVPYQSVEENFRIKIQTEEQIGVSDEQLRANLARLAAQAFDLSNGPLLKVWLVRLSDDEHIMLVLIHHIVADGASMRVLFRELAALYEARLEGADAELPDLPVQYADFSVWQREWLDGEELQRQTDYWVERLQGLPPLLELPWDRPRSAAMRYRGASVLRVLPPELADELRALGRGQGCTLFMVMLAAFYVMLMRYSGRDDLVVGTPMGGRPRSDLEGLIGFFINTVVLRADLGGDPSFTDLMRSVRDVALEAHANQELPFEKLVEVLQPERELSYSPVFQVMFDLQEEPRWRLPVRNLEVVPEVVFSSRTSSFDLTLSVRQAEDGLDAMFEYDTDLFDEVTIERMAAHYQSLLNSIVAAPDEKISRLALMDSAARSKLVETWGSRTAAYPEQHTLISLFEAQAAQQPAATAVVAGDIACSYGELNRRANRLAFRLQSLGVVPGETVALCAERSLNFVAGMLGVLKAGSCFVPLDPAYPKDRLQQMLRDSSTTMLLHEQGYKLDAPDGVRVLEISDALFVSPDYPDENPQCPAEPDDPAFLLYTSGSTGRAKGVELAHRGCINYIHHLGTKTSITTDDRILQFGSLSFDISIEESFAALLHGATLVLRHEGMQESVDAFVEGCNNHEISWLSLPTAWWHELCSSLGDDAVELPATIRSVIIGGERALPSAFAHWRSHVGSRIQLINTYGPAETSIVATWCDLTHLEVSNGGELPIGHPVPNVRAWVLDEYLQPLPPGVPGELYIGGVGVARGYRNRPEQTAKAFLHDPLNPAAEARLYRTGDRARYMPDGRLFFMGRVDDQVKIRGHRIEPREVETVLQGLEQVESAVVLARTLGSGELGLVAYVVGPPDKDWLQKSLRSLLPEYMLPAAIVFLEEMPLTANGKLDLYALPEPAPVRDTSRAYVAPRSELEMQVAAIWSDVLGVERVGIHDDFFALGGHSLLATRVVARVRDALDRALPLRALFNQPSVASLAELLQESAKPSGEAPLQPRNAADGLPPLSWSQERLWFLDQLEPESTAYNLPWTARLRGHLDRERLQAAVNKLVARHESLRTSFGVRDGEPVQLIMRDATVSIVYEDRSGTSAEDLDAHLRKLIGESFDLHSGPLLRVNMLRVAQDEHVLVLVMHHIVSDGWSMGILFKELAALYAAESEGLPARLPELAVQYADFAVWQRKWLSGSELDRQLDYWRQQLEGAPPLLDLPLDYPRPPVQSYHGAWESRRLDSDLLSDLNSLAAREGCTLFMLLLAAFKLLVARHTGSDDVVVGTPIAGRGRTELESLIGFFLNTLVLRTRLDGNPTFLELLERTRTTTVDAYDHQDLPFEKLLEVLQPERSTAHSPVVQVMFNLQNAPTESFALPDIEIDSFMLERGTAKFDLSVVLTETEQGLQLGLEYNTDLFRADTMAGLIEQYERLLREICRQPDQCIADVRLTDPVQYPSPVQQPSEFAEAELDCTVPERFARMVRSYPQRLAVQSSGFTWTYTELDQRSNAVAWELQKYAGERIGVCMPHDAPALAAILGILKAGCTYVPLDIEAPAKRREQIINEAEIAYVVETIPEDGRADAPASQLLADDPAYILFTSGSTGKPKGVTQNHRNLLHHARTYIEALCINETDRLSLVAAFGFDAAVMDIYGALLSGACLCPVDLRSARNPLAELEQLQISIWHSTPTVFRVLLEGAQPSLERVRAAVLGGEEALVQDFELFRHCISRPALFVNGLGPSESTLALQFFADHDTRLAGNTVPVGLPVTGVEARLLDKSGKRSGLSGELALRSRYVSTGYWQQPALTQEKFRPVSASEYLLDYYTGDCLRVMPDGQFAFTGRIDAHFKLRGHRIEPGEIEYLLTLQEGVEHCAVIMRGQDAETQSLVAYIVGTAEETLLKNALADRLPDYMVPSAFVRLERLPLTPNGKLDVKALPAPLLRRAREAGYAEPRNSTEAELVKIWKEVLPAEEIGIHDDFFALGGHSLVATRLVARIRDRLGYELPLRAVFSNPTVAGMAALLVASEASHAEVPLKRRPSTGELPPLSWAQQRLWFLNQLEPESAAYNLHWAARLTGHLKQEALQKSLNELVARHESLRTRFVGHAGEPVQLIMPAQEIPLRIEALPGAGDVALQTRLLELIRETFDLSAGPLLRAHVLRVSDEESVLLLVMHHIVSDGWSMGVLFDELARLYNAELKGVPAGLPDLPVQYADFALWQRAWLSGAELERQVGYWQEQLHDAPPLLELPLDHARPPVQRYRGAWVNQTFSPELLDGLRSLAAREGCTLFMVLLAAFKLLLARHTGSEDIVVGTPIAGRRRTELEGLIGFFLNTLALRTDIRGNPTFEELLARVRVSTLDAYEHQELPFEKLLEVLQPQRSTAHTPVVQVMFNLHNEPASGLSLAGLAVSPFSVDRGTAKFDLSVALVEGASGLQAGFEYNTDLFERQTVDLLLRHYGELLWSIVRDTQQRIAAYSMTSAAAAPAVLPAGVAIAGNADSLSECFVAAVSAHSERPAVNVAGQIWNYRELDERANAVAAKLAGYSGARVGLLLGHDGYMLAGMLGALKAGCAYVPLDPDAPLARLQSVIADAEIRTVVVDRALSDLLCEMTELEIVKVDDTRLESAPNVSIAPDDLAYILFTSGSTGTPKGVMQSHRNVMHHVRTYVAALQISFADRMTLLPGYGFDAAVMDIFGALFSGACLYPMKLRDEEYPGELLDRMGEHRISILHSTPTVFRHLMRNKVCRHDLSCVRFVVLGGEEALANDFALFRKQFAPPALFVNGLGPSESTLTLQFFADHGTRLPGNVVPVGSPVDGTEVLLLNEDGSEAGIVGELAIRSRYVSSGYWKQPELTKERFIPDLSDPELVLYRTGDRARYLPDGQLVFIGRVDDQVKIRGHRIEPGEIEAMALNVGGVERCAVVLNRFDRGEARLVAYVVGDADMSLLRDELRSALPEYMVPSVFMQIDELPLTANGKLDRNALPVPALARDDRKAYVEPRNDIEERLAALWSEVLGVERISVHDDFFELGGHSLMAAQLVARVTDTLQVGLPIRRLFDSPTIAGIAEHVETLRWALAPDSDESG